jgi:hypothetical protein
MSATPQKDGYIYLASPYSAKKPDGSLDHEIMEQRFDAVCRHAGKMMNCGIVVYSPIAQCHPIAVRVGLPRTWDFWERFDRVMIQGASKLVILRLPGWRESTGVTAERKIAEELGIEITEVDP